jgi:hypothetical protein
VSAPSSTERLAFSPPISVRTQPGHTEFTAHFGNAAASCTVTPFSAVFVSFRERTGYSLVATFFSLAALVAVIYQAAISSC